jgi:ubiquitin thioesterase protein OTUB1
MLFIIALIFILLIILIVFSFTNPALIGGAGKKKRKKRQKKKKKKKKKKSSSGISISSVTQEIPPSVDNEKQKQYQIIINELLYKIQKTFQNTTSEMVSKYYTFNDYNTTTYIKNNVLNKILSFLDPRDILSEVKEIKKYIEDSMRITNVNYVDIYYYYKSNGFDRGRAINEIVSVALDNKLFTMENNDVQNVLPIVNTLEAFKIKSTCKEIMDKYNNRDNIDTIIEEYIGKMPSEKPEKPEKLEKLEKLELNIRIPEKKVSEIIDISDKKISDYNSFKAFLETIWDKSTDYLIYKIEDDGYGIELWNENPGSSHTTFGELKNGDIIEIRALKGNIGAKANIFTLASIEKHNVQLQEKIRLLSNKYNGCRRIRGDGNCYFRSIIFSIMEQIVYMEENKKKAALNNLKTKLKDIRYDSLEYDNSEYYNNSHKFLIDYLDGAIDGNKMETPDDLEYDMLQEDNTSIDNPLIRASRGLVSNYLLSNQDTILAEGGLPLQSAILPSYEDCRNMNEFCDKYIKAMDVDVEGAFIELGILPSLLGCACTIVYLSRIEGNDLKDFTNAPIDTSVPLNINIHILLKPGHYDMLYPK